MSSWSKSSYKLVRGIFEKERNCARCTNNFYRRDKAVLSMMSQCLMVSKTKFRHSVTTTFCIARFSVKALSLWPFCENLIKLRIFVFFSLVLRMSTEQRINQKLLVRLGNSPTETLKLLQEVYGDDTMSRTRLFEWHRRFKEGREEVEDDHRSGRPSTSRTDENVERVRQKVRSDCSLTVRIIVDELGMNSERVWRIFTEDLGMRKVWAKMVPRLLNERQKKWRVQVCQDILEQPKTDPTCWKKLLLAMSHGSLSTIHSPKGRALNGKAHCHQDPKRRGCSSPKPRWCWSLFLMSMELPTQNSFHKAKLLISTSTQTSCDVWCAQWGRRELWETRSWLLHHDNAPAYNALGIREFLDKNNVAVLEQPPYSADLAPCAFFLFPKLKEAILKELVFKIQKPFKQPWRESFERSLRNPSRSAWKRGKGDWKSAFEPKEITLKATCCKIYLSNKMKHL